MTALVTMFLLRPYVFGFLVAFLFLAIRLWGSKRTLLWLVLGYTIAWASEALSIRTGFPYGWYFYKVENLQQDILLAGVPIWDSLSYTFLIFAGYTTAQYRFPQLSPAWQAVAGGFATMLLDIMIDPVANLGRYWFLGDIYYYPTGGAHFGVPISNYLGWFWVSWAVIRVFQLCHSEGNVRRISRVYPAFFLAIGIFNTVIAAWIGAWGIAGANTFLLVCCAIVGFQRNLKV